MRCWACCCSRHLEGRPLQKVFEQRIFVSPLGMGFTQFAATDPVPSSIIRGYVDLYSNLQVIESTYYSGWDYYTADGGLISNPHDLALFMHALCAGDLLPAAALAEMTAWRTPSQVDTEFFPVAYGLGLFRMQTPWGEAWFHSGDAIGYYACMAWFPQQQVALSWAVNGNYGRIDEATQTRTAMERIFSAALGQQLELPYCPGPGALPFWGGWLIRTSSAENEPCTSCGALLLNAKRPGISPGLFAYSGCSPHSFTKRPSRRPWSARSR